ncbi:MAG: GTP-binding protein [Erysipelotrichaceae bacterium]|nr:GTP-binding protein [Erysipelotrichaceae bacterium]
MKRTVLGILAHVDAGKTTCIESMLYLSGAIRKMGRVDHKDAFLDYDEQERDHGITIYAKEAHFFYEDTEVFVIDTPGHVDFSAEMERTLQALDLAVILINGQDGVQAHTETIWNCLQTYNVPAVIFVNKMDISFRSREELLADLKRHCSSSCILWNEDRQEELAMVSEEMMNRYLEEGTIPAAMVRQAVAERKCFPVLFGSALKQTGIRELLDCVAEVCPEKHFPDEFGARVYKISRDSQGSRLCHVRMTGGVLKARQKLNDEDKVDQIRIYNGQVYTMVQEAEAGMICVLKGPLKPEAGDGLGFEKDARKPLLNAYMDYQLTLPKGVDVLALSEVMQQLASEDPQLEIVSDPEAHVIRLSIMGEMQKDVVQKKIYEASGIRVGFTEGRVLFAETVAESMEGAGHFEPLRHYAEVHVRLDPLPRGQGIVVADECPNDMLSANWRRSILSVLRETRHRGVLTGSPLTDVRISLTAGRGHLKHTEGGDFREAARRAVRQALKKAECIVLEPYYDFTLKVSSDVLSRALYDLETRSADVEMEDLGEGMMLIRGRGPVRKLMNYQAEVSAYTRGKGIFACSTSGYEPCRDQEEVILERGYDSETDRRNPTGSVFCAHGSGFYVPWDEADRYMHVILSRQENDSAYEHRRYHVGEDEMKALIQSSSSNNRNPAKQRKPKKKEDEELKNVKARPSLPPYMIVDGYNMIFEWDDLKELAKQDLYDAREKLVTRLMNYQAYANVPMSIVFDGWRVRDNYGTVQKMGNVEIVYTRTDETADQRIEKMAYDMHDSWTLTVVTSDSLIQNAVFAQGALRMSSRELRSRIESLNAMLG